ncbi:division/cell wall cluster transcriptional repressor MraZ [Basilea psittacipulmonis]|nr:division/cell wall cluster transcriptional repressor MraZ [Basilea psittacipulmonis]
MTIPTRYRDYLKDQVHGELTITLNFEGGLMIYPRPEWIRKSEILKELPASKTNVQRILLGSARDVEIDSAGRILIAPELRSQVNIEKDVVLVGMGNRFELWSAEQYAAQLERDKASVLAQGLGDFSL